MKRRFIPLAVLALAVLMQTSPIPLRVWDLGEAGLSLATLPAGAVPVRPPTQADFNRDGSPEHLVLAGDRLSIFSGDASVWQNPSGWTVVQAGITDLDRDGAPEAALLVWRPFQP